LLKNCVVIGSDVDESTPGFSQAIHTLDQFRAAVLRYAANI
jgi:hypothetical protein